MAEFTQTEGSFYCASMQAAETSRPGGINEAVWIWIFINTACVDHISARIISAPSVYFRWKGNCVTNYFKESVRIFCISGLTHHPSLAAHLTPQ